MDKDITTEPLSADEFGRRSIRRFAQRPGVIPLDTVRGQSERISRMVSNKTPLLDHVQRYLPTDPTNIYGQQKFMTYAHPAGVNNFHSGTNAHNPDAVMLQSTGQSMLTPSLSGGDIQRRVSITSSAANNSEPHGLIQTKSGQAKQGMDTDVSGAIKASLPDTNTVISEPMISRHLSTPMILQKQEVSRGLISKATDAGTSGGDNLKSTNTPASSAPVSVSAVDIANPAKLELSGSIPDMLVQRKKEVSNTVKNSDTEIKIPQSLGTGIIQRYADMNVTKPLVFMQNDSQSDHSLKLITTATPLLQRKESEEISLGLQRSPGTYKAPGERSVYAAGTVGIHTNTETPIMLQKTITSTQSTDLPVTGSGRNQSLSHLASVNNHSQTVSMKEQTGFKHNDQYKQSISSQTVKNSTSTGQTLYRKPADLHLLSGDTHNAGNNSNSYSNNIIMPVVTPVNRMSDENIISRTIDTGAVASNEVSSTSVAQAEQSEAGTPSVNDELIEKIFSRLLRRMAVESERKGWRS